MRQLKEIIDSTMRTTIAAQEAEATVRGTTPEGLEAEKQRLAERARRAHAVVASGILLAGDDVDRIADQTFQVTLAIRHVKDWAASETDRRVLILCGPVGIGKSFAAAVAIASLGQGIAVKSGDLPAAIHPYAADLQRGVMTLPLKHPFLVLDDLGAEADPQERRWADAFAAFVESRQMYGRTLITSNLPKRALRERYDARIIDRLDAVAQAIWIDGKSLRRAGGGL